MDDIKTENKKSGSNPFGFGEPEKREALDVN